MPGSEREGESGSPTSAAEPSTTESAGHEPSHAEIANPASCEAESPQPATDETGREPDRRAIFWVLFVSLLIADQLVKILARHSLAERGSITVIPNVFDLTLTFNKGIAFGMFQGFGPLLAPIAVAIAVGAIMFSIRHKGESGWAHAAMALLASGALGNLVDRLVFGQVTDMFHIRTFDFPVFNLADSCITVAASILIVRWTAEWFIESKERK